MAHTVISASNMERVCKCPASVELSKGMEKFDTDWSSEGTDAHLIATICAERVRNVVMSIEMLPDFPDEMIRYAEEYATFSRERWSPDCEVYFEQKVEFSDMVKGTADQIIVDREKIHIIDYKYGEGKLVNALNNYQLIFYLLGAIKKYGRRNKYIVSIFQPRVSDAWEDKFSEWEPEEHELDLFEQLFIKTIEDVENGEVHFRRGDHCQFCPVKPRCPEWGAVNSAVVEYKTTHMAPELLSEEKAAFIQKHGDELCSWIRAVQSYNLKKALNGDVLPEHKLVEGRSSRTWCGSEEEIAKVISSAGLDPYDRKLLPFSKVEKKMGKKNFEAALGDYLVKPRGKLKLVHQSAPGQPVNATAGSEFSGLDLFNEEIDYEMD